MVPRSATQILNYASNCVLNHREVLQLVDEAASVIATKFPVPKPPALLIQLAHSGESIRTTPETFCADHRRIAEIGLVNRKGTLFILENVLWSRVLWAQCVICRRTASVDYEDERSGDWDRGEITLAPRTPSLHEALAWIVRREALQTQPNDDPLLAREFLGFCPTHRSLVCTTCVREWDSTELTVNMAQLWGFTRCPECSTQLTLAALKPSPKTRAQLRSLLKKGNKKPWL